jgi:hypothetical protein
VHRFTAAIVAFLASASLLGCRKPSAANGVGGSAPSASAALAGSGASAVNPANPPLDHLGPGEIPPGTETAYGLVLPRGMKVLARFPGVVHASGALSPEDVSNYVRDRVLVSRVELGAVETVFPGVRVKGGEAQKLLRIEVIPLGDRTKLVVTDTSPPAVVPPEEHLTDAERWRRAGYNPDGTLIDPNKLR